LDSIVEWYMRTVKDHLKKVVLIHWRDWDERLPLILLAYRASTHETTGMTPIWCLGGSYIRPTTCSFRFPHPNKEQQMTDMTNSMKKLHDSHHYA
jgi:hypothetical protein